MRIVYTGPIDAVDIAETGTTATRGEPVEVSDELGARLCEQDCWQPAKAGRKSTVSEEQG